MTPGRGRVASGRLFWRWSAKRALLAAVSSSAAFVPATAAWGQAGEPGLVAFASAALDDLPTDHRRGFPAISLADLPKVGFTAVRAQAGVVGAMLEGRPIQLYVGSPFFRYGRRVYQLPNPPYHADGTYWIPASLLRDWTTGGRGSSIVQTTAATERSSASGSGAVTEPAPSGPMRPLRVVIDAGHGGRDPGTSGRRGTREKDVVLAIAKRVHAELARTPDVEAILTRDRDVLIPLRKRSQLAIAQQADLFVSIHANASRNRSARGFETYFLGEAKTELSREVAMRENSAVQYEEEGEAPRAEEIQFILARLNLASYQRESGRVGGLVQDHLRSVLRTPDRGVKQNVFWVLVGATGSMPSILVEVGFLSNAEEEQFLRSRTGQERIARAIVEAITAYRDDYAPRLQAAGAR